MSQDEVRAYWDGEASTFDDEPDHGLTSDVARAAWWTLLSGLLPDPPVRVADLGCGTGSISLLLAEHGYDVTGVDLSPRMIERARAKARTRGLDVSYCVGDAGYPPWAPGALDVVFARHVVWALPQPRLALRRWAELLVTDGRLVLVEGRWTSGAGVAAVDLRALIPDSLRDVHVVSLPQQALWGKQTDDERYALSARRC
jgi:SAM-dependent methyltransferase